MTQKHPLQTHTPKLEVFATIERAFINLDKNVNINVIIGLIIRSIAY